MGPFVLLGFVKIFEVIIISQVRAWRSGVQYTSPDMPDLVGLNYNGQNWSIYVNRQLFYSNGIYYNTLIKEFTLVFEGCQRAPQLLIYNSPRGLIWQQEDPLLLTF